ncbi:hypothetical protein SASPL_100971 [Salvia splendens]|uniref:GIR1-like zinc ribbon domain-containing protein n=1 Tax=Salvia splendens TaxID=180675 RepID=A0A8X8YR21_SALSN|nr:hypothetical protein SASPL_100971 [Salvia splendens]
MQFNSLVQGVAEMKKCAGESPKLELKLNLSPPGEHRQVVSPRGAEISPQSSCVSRETSPEAMSMMLVGCPRCLMYVMLFQDHPKCPKCKSTVLLNITLTT